MLAVLVPCRTDVTAYPVAVLPRRSSCSASPRTCCSPPTVHFPMHALHVFHRRCFCRTSNAAPPAEGPAVRCVVPTCLPGTCALLGPSYDTLHHCSCLPLAVWIAVVSASGRCWAYSFFSEQHIKSLARAGGSVYSTLTAGLRFHARSSSCGVFPITFPINGSTHVSEDGGCLSACMAGREHILIVWCILNAYVEQQSLQSRIPECVWQECTGS